MKLIDSISRFVNYEMTALDHTIKKIASNPSVAKKVLQIANKIFAAIDLYSIGHTQERDVTKAMKGSTDLIEFYGSYKNLMFWVNLFSKESLDENLLKESIESSLCASHKDEKDIEGQKELARMVFTEVTKKESYHSKEEVVRAMKESLQAHGYTPEKARQITERVIVQQKARPLTKLVCMACFTFADLGSNVLTLKKWHIVDLFALATSIGSGSRLFMFVINLSADTVLGTVASAGLLVVVGEASYRTIKEGMRVLHARSHSTLVDQKERDEAYKEFRNALIDLFAGGTDLVFAATPLFFALNPPVIVALALIAKGTGLVCILIR